MNKMIILLVIAIIFLHMCLIWLWYRYTNNPSVVDVGWASGLTLAGLIYLNNQEFSLRSLLLVLALLAWGIRLGGYLWWTRIRLKKIDKRYLALSNDWKLAKPLGFFLNFQLQGVLICLVSIPWYFSSLETQTTLNLLDGLALMIFLTALILETVADNQLQDFKKNYPGKVCNQKLWRYCRHPNYFYEWLVWCSFTLFALSAPYGWIAIISPLTLYLIMTKITAPMTEQGSIESRGNLYIEYQKVTPMFFPKWLKNNSTPRK
ncbi:TPA: DUF1295 domain-containing protein [Legionella pneumophila]|nr:DUF1295 domain-containing protein [Legionella pneumophila]